MAKPSFLPTLEQIHHPKTSAEHITALRALKNDIVGHQQKKETWVGLGILEPIVEASTSKANKKSQKSCQEQTIDAGILGEEETLRLQALSILGSLAYGGPPFIAPLHSASALPAILSNLCPSTNPPQLVLSALQALSNLTESTCLSLASHAFNIISIADSLFSPPHVASMCNIINQTSSPHVHRQISIAASLINSLCRDERHQSSLADAGVLDALAERLAEIVVLQGLVIPGADITAEKEGFFDKFPPAASESADLARLLESIAVIVADSKLRASQLVYSNAILAIFPLFPIANFTPNHSTKAAWDAYNAADTSSRQSRLNAIDYIIPNVSAGYTKGVSAHTSAFPPLGTGSFDSIMQFGDSKSSIWSQPSKLPNDAKSSIDCNGLVDSDEPESPLIPYLIWLTRSSFEVERLMSAYLLTVLYRAGVTDKSRDTSIGQLVIPLLLGLLEDSTEPSAIKDEHQVSKHWLIEERAPAIIAKLIVDSEYLQKSAYEAGIVSKLAKTIKSSYGRVPTNHEARTWYPNACSDEHSSKTSQLGDCGFSPRLVHKIKVREGVLRAIAALTPFKDEYRKALIEQGIMPCIVESLKPYPDKPSIKLNENSENTLDLNTGEISSLTSGFGVNPISVLIAACGAVRHLSRSVSILRTTLVDNGVVMPIFNLLSHSDIEVQIAATATVCNIVTEFSPMRETISAAGVLKILCQHAHSVNVNLRLNALWALKHLVQSAGNDTKKACLEELGQDWLVQLICEDTEDEAIYSTPGSMAIVDQDNDVHMNDSDEEDDNLRMPENAGGTNGSHKNSRFGQSSSDSQKKKEQSSSTIRLVNSRFAILRDVEVSPSKKAREKDVAVQEQGLDFIRNLIGGYNSTGAAEHADMIDFLFSNFGQDQIFEILASKLRPKTLNPFSRRNSGSGVGKNNETRILPPQPEIITAVEYILANIAASIPRHRQQVMAQTELLKNLLAQSSNHPDKEVRLALCWLVINLTWVEDDQDNTQRADELVRLGFLAKMEVLERDGDFDVSERAKTAVYQMKQTVMATGRPIS